EHGDLCVAVSELLTMSESFVPNGLGSFDERLDLGLRWICCGSVVRSRADVVDRRAMHADDVEERLAVVVITRASASGDRAGIGHHEFAGGREWRTLLGDHARLPV